MKSLLIALYKREVKKMDNERIADMLDKTFAWSVSRTFSREEAEELTQEILLQALGSVSGLRDDSKFEPWFWRLADMRTESKTLSNGKLSSNRQRVPYKPISLFSTKKSTVMPLKIPVNLPPPCQSNFISYPVSLPMKYYHRDCKRQNAPQMKSNACCRQCCWTNSCRITGRPNTKDTSRDMTAVDGTIPDLFKMARAAAMWVSAWKNP